jgi:oxygen-dependent protoporphyrinogen oxidase
MARRSVVVIGGGIAGLAAAWELSGGDAGEPRDDLRIEIVERAHRLGGSLRLVELDGRTIDAGPDGFLARRPEAVAFVEGLGLGNELEDIDAAGAWLFLDGRLQRIPEGLVLGVPTSAKSLKSLHGLGWRAKRNLWRDEHAPRNFTVGEDPTIGEIVRAKLGDEVAHYVVEPMIGGIQAGRIDELSARAVFPQLVAAAEKGGSLMKALATPSGAGAASGAAFKSLVGGVGSLPAAIEERLVARGVIISKSTEAISLRRSATEFYRFEIDTHSTTTAANAVVVAVPPRAAGALLGHYDEALAAIGEMDAASSAMVTFAVDATAVQLPVDGTGVLVPLGTPFGEETLMVTALTFLDRKWPHLRKNGTALIRAHVGRIDDTRAASLDDSALTARVTSELATILGAPVTARDTVVVRHPAGLPQYRPGHLTRVAAAREAAARLGVSLAGNAYDGVGIPASIGSGRRAGREALAIVEATA